jgi:Fe-S-cluster containining protein
VGQVINIPVDVNNMVTLLPRDLDDYFSFNFHIKRNLIHKSISLEGIVNKDTIKRCLAYLINTPLYRHYNITINDSFFHRQLTIEEENIQWIEDLEHSSDVELLIAQQQTLLWNEETCLEIASAGKNTPLSIIYDEHAEEFSFSGIYLGRARQFKEEHKVTQFKEIMGVKFNIYSNL